MSTGRLGPFVQARTVLKRRRALAVAGEVLLDVGDRVAGDTVVARARGRGVMHTVNASSLLDIAPAELPAAMVCAVGETVAAGQVLARSRALFGLLSSVCRAPVAGTVAAVSPHTGRVLLEEPGGDLEVRAFLPGIISTREEGRAVTVAGWAARVAGVFGVGGECAGPLVPVVGRPEAVLEAAALDAAHAGAILLGGALVRADGLRRATELGVRGIITGGVHDADLVAWLEQEVVLADTTTLAAPLTLVVTGGFGRVPVEDAAFRLLRALAGQQACLSGQTRVRAGARRPEVIVPLVTEADDDVAAVPPPSLAVGSRVMVVREPWFGCCGRIGELPRDAVRLPNEVRVGAAHVDLDAGRSVVVPLANLEVLAGPAGEEARP